MKAREKRRKRIQRKANRLVRFVEANTRESYELLAQVLTMAREVGIPVRVMGPPR